MIEIQLETWNSMYGITRRVRKLETVDELLKVILRWQDDPRFKQLTIEITPK